MGFVTLLSLRAKDNMAPRATKMSSPSLPVLEDQVAFSSRTKVLLIKYLARSYMQPFQLRPPFRQCFYVRIEIVPTLAVLFYSAKSYTIPFIDMRDNEAPGLSIREGIKPILSRNTLSSPAS